MSTQTPLACVSPFRGAVLVASAQVSPVFEIQSDALCCGAIVPILCALRMRVSFEAITLKF